MKNLSGGALIGGHPLSTYSNFSEQLTFLTLSYAHARVHINGLEMLVFRKILRTYLWMAPCYSVIVNKVYW